MLSLLCVTKAEEFSAPFIYALVEMGRHLNADVVVAADGADAFTRLAGLRGARVIHVNSAGYIESVLDEALTVCLGDYVLRLDDDERISSEMGVWLAREFYTESDHWKFSRAHLWRDTETAIVNAPLWPDHQTRLSVREKAGGRHTVHAGSPFGGGTIAPVLFEHHKFLVKTFEARREIAARYDRVQEGFGSGNMLPFNLPEAVWTPGQLQLRTMPELVAQVFEDAVAARGVAS